jgi:hypothetical protein
MIQSLAWEERNYIEQMKNYDNKKVSEIKGTTIETKTSLMQNDWKDITDPKLRGMMRDRVYSREYKKNNKEKIKQYRQENKIKINLKHKEWIKKNHDKHKAYMKEYCKKRYDNDIQFRISTVLRTRLGRAIRDEFKIGSAIKDLGCSIADLKSYLESKFLIGMTWDNHGLDGWHIDHIKPLSAFNLSDRKQILEACHYTNLQPLWAKDNLSKSDNY